MLRVLIPSKPSPEMLAVLGGYPELEIDAPGTLDPAELAAALPRADAVIVRSNHRLTSELLAVASQLRVIGRAGTGVDNIDVEAATRRGILVMNVPGENAIATAEHTFALLLGLVRRIPAAHRSMVEGRWERGRFRGLELHGKTLGVIGLGRIGTAVANRALGFEMRVVAYDPYVPRAAERDPRIRRVALDELLETSDFVSVHVPLDESTRHLIGTPEIAAMKPGVCIVNCARGGIVDEAALCDAIESGRVAGAALDVFESEPPRDPRVTRSDRILCTPHLGGSTAEAQERIAGAIARQVGDFLTRGVVVHAVNAPR